MSLGVSSAALAASPATTVTLIPDDAGFGLTFGGAKTVVEGEDYGYGIFVSGTKEGSVAANEPAIVAGLQILTMCVSWRRRLAAPTLRAPTRNTPPSTSSYGVLRRSITINAGLTLLERMCCVPRRGRPFFFFCFFFFLCRNGVDLSDATFVELKTALRGAAGDVGGVTLVLCPNETLHKAYAARKPRRAASTEDKKTDEVLSMPAEFTSSA